MKLTKQEMHFDFKGTQFDLSQPRERELLGWVFNQFLYGEVTGIQCGYWLYRAPSLAAAQFLAKQAGEELSHVRRILRVLSILGQRPTAPHRVIRFLTTGMMGGSWGEHVAIEMALGEGLVLQAFYALAATVGEPEAKKILETSVLDEERHVDFGERETEAWIAARPRSRKLLLTLALVQWIALSRVRRYVVRRLTREVGAGHPVLSQFDAFYEHSLACMETRVQRIGLCDRRLRVLGTLEKLGLLTMLPLRKAVGWIADRTPLLTDSFLRDPWVEREEANRSQAPAV